MQTQLVLDNILGEVQDLHSLSNPPKQVVHFELQPAQVVNVSAYVLSLQKHLPVPVPKINFFFVNNF